jgi:serine/threonine protein phosphatase PrpC
MITTSSTQTEPHDGRRLVVGVATDPGKVREANEDRYLIDQELGLWVVADGMGGHNAGEVASALAVQTIRDHVALHGSTAHQDAACEVLIEALLQAHRTIEDSALGNNGLQGMGTTAVVVWLPRPWRYVWHAHVGDSRIYLLRNGQLIRQTRDHTIQGQLAAAGRIPDNYRQQAARGPLSQALGASQFIAPDAAQIEAKVGDRILLCSDGLTDMVSDQDIADCLESAAQPQAACDALVAAAREQGGRDNITVIVVQLMETTGSA